MGHHENNGHADDHNHDNTEGNRQYYGKGWWMPLIGLGIIAISFAFLGGWILNMSGTDKWGKTEQCCEDGKCKEGEKDKPCCKEGKPCKEHEGEHEAAAAGDHSRTQDSVAATNAPKEDSLKPVEQK